VRTLLEHLTEVDRVPENSLVSTTQSDKKKARAEKTSNSWMCSATWIQSSEFRRNIPCVRCVPWRIRGCNHPACPNPACRQPGSRERRVFGITAWCTSSHWRLISY